MGSALPAGRGRLEDTRFKKYYCNKCEKEYQGGPNIEFENPNEDLGENIILIEKGEYKCKTCDYVIAQYRKFNESNNVKNQEKQDNKNFQSADNNRTQGVVKQVVGPVTKTEAVENDATKSENVIKEEKEQTSVIIANASAANAATSVPSPSTGNNKYKDSKSDYIQIEKIIGMLTYDHNAQLIGSVDEIGLRKTSDGRVEFSFKVKDSDNAINEISWNRISKIGDIIILLSLSPGSNTSNTSKYNSNDSTNIKTSADSKPQEKICKNCNYSNEAESVFCEECGNKLE